MTNKEIYANLSNSESTISIYDQPWWLDAVCGGENWDVILYNKNGNIIGALPYYIKQKYGLKYVSQPQFTQHNGVWIKYPDNIKSESKKLSFEIEVINGLIAQIEDMNFQFYQQAQSPALTNWLPFYWRGYTQTTYYTYRLNDIHDMEALFNNFQPNKRKNIKKALRAGLQVKFDMPSDQFYKLHKSTLEKQNKKIFYSYGLFEKIYNAAYENDSGRTAYVVDSNGKILCAVFNLWDKERGYDLISANEPEAKNVGALDFLVYSMIDFLRTKVNCYDFEGSMIQGVEESFRHFGATQTPYFVIRKVYSRNLILKSAIKKLGNF